jgi:hypothetical protein
VLGPETHSVQRLGLDKEAVRAGSERNAEFQQQARFVPEILVCSWHGGFFGMLLSDSVVINLIIRCRTTGCDGFTFAACGLPRQLS